MFIIRLPNTTLSPFLINPPLIPLPSHNGKATVLELLRFGNTSGPPLINRTSVTPGLRKVPSCHIRGVKTYNPWRSVVATPL
jgi:hypothetical protein